MIKVLISDLFEILENRKSVQFFKDNFKEGKLLLVPSTPHDRKTTEKYGDEVCKLFKKNKIYFSEVEYFYEDLNFNEIANKINDYALIFLMGGMTLTQNEFIHKVRLKEILQNYDGILIGMSAGALNMCEKTIDTPIESDHDGNVILKGLGVTDIIVEVHFDVNNKEQIKAIDETGFIFYCISNNGAIVLRDNEMFTYGDVYKYENKKLEIV